MNEVAELELPTQENFRTDLRTLFQGAVRAALEVVLEEEIREMVGRTWKALWPASRLAWRTC